MEDRQSRLLFALLISMGLWLGINYIFFPKKPEPKVIVESNNTQKKEIIENSKLNIIDKKNKNNEIIESKIIPAKEIQSNQIQTNSFIVKFSSLGGRISEFYIKDYNDMDGNPVRIVRDPSMKTVVEGKEIPAIELSRNEGFDFNISNNINAIQNSEWNSINFTENYNQDLKTITYLGNSPDKNILIKKEFQFFENENYFKFRLTIKNNSKQTILLASADKPLYFRSFGSLGPITGKSLSDREKTGFFRFYHMDNSFNDSIDGSSSVGFFGSFFGSEKQLLNRYSVFEKESESLDFCGTGSRYFISVLDPLKNSPDGVILDNENNNTTGIVVFYNNIKLEKEEKITFDYANYVGIREADGMMFRNASLDPNQSKDSPFFGLSEALNKSFNQGLTTPFRNGIVYVLKKLYQFTIPNYGWCIVLFSILFKLIFYPLNQKQAESMKKMQELSPQIKAINEKYEKDPQTKQKKTMELYKVNKVNPMGGCLPMLIQIPIFIALYTAFSDTIELWKSPFLWVTDLSEPDTIWNAPTILGISGLTLNLLPLIMVGSQIVQTKMTSVSTDPNQKALVYIMPIIMVYFFWSMPAGVTLYWTVQNFLSIVQQILTNKFGKNKK